MPSSLFCLWKSTKAVHNSLSFLFQYNYVILQVRHSKFKNLQLHLKQYQKKKKKNASPSPIQVLLLLQYTTIPIKYPLNLPFQKPQSVIPNHNLLPPETFFLFISSVHSSISWSRRVRKIKITKRKPHLSGRNCNHKILNRDSILFSRNPSTFPLPCRVYARSRTRAMEPEGARRSRQGKKEHVESTARGTSRQATGGRRRAAFQLPGRVPDAPTRGGVAVGVAA